MTTAEHRPIDTAGVAARLAELQTGDLPTHGGRSLAYVYDSGLAEVDELGRTALAQYGHSNGLDPTAFPSLLLMEREVIARCAEVLHAPAGAVGTVTSGGTESVLLAVQTARDAHPKIEQPAMVLPTSAHAAFHKAAHYFGIRAVFVEVDPTTARADPAGLAAAIDSDTVLVVASAPSYAHGVVDPVSEIASVAARSGVRCHVDACIGGWVLGHAADRSAGFDFAVPGVTSISVDLHKYAYTPKGVSVLLHRDPALRRPQFFASAAWPGYTMLNTTMQSTKSGGPLAAAWAVLTAIGPEGYVELSRKALRATEELADAVTRIDGLEVLVAPDSTLLALRADERCDVFTIADELASRGWYVQPQMRFGPFPATLHLSVSAATAEHIEDCAAALGAAASAARAAGPVAIAPELVGAAARLDPATLSDEVFDGLLALAGLDVSAGLPERMGPVNALLDAVPPALREALLIAFLDRLSRT